MTPDFRIAPLALGFGVIIGLFAACGGQVPSNTKPPRIDTFFDDSGSDGDASIPVTANDAPGSMMETHDGFAEASVDGNIPQLDLDAQAQISDAYFPFWAKALEGGYAESELVACNRCVFGGSPCDFPEFHSECYTGTLCVFEHCDSTTDGASLWECIDSCFRIGSPCVPRWSAYMACTVQACASVCP